MSLSDLCNETKKILDKFSFYRHFKDYKMSAMGIYSITLFQCRILFAKLSKNISNESKFYKCSPVWMGNFHPETMSIHHRRNSEEIFLWYGWSTGN